MLVDFLCTLGFIASRYDQDAWMDLQEDRSGYAYICTYVDDFQVSNTYPEMWIDRISAVFLVKYRGPWAYYLGNNYQFHDGSDVWTQDTKMYTKEALA